MKTFHLDSSIRRVRAVLLTVALAWSVLIAGLFAWNYWSSYRAILDVARVFANESFGKDLAFRHWASIHGGVYATITPESPPNPYLADVPERDLTTPSGKKLTLINPAYMMRQVYELGAMNVSSRAHITSLNPLRPENAPDPWERHALQAFERGEMEVSSIEQMGAESYFRFMRPIRVDGGCLGCHAKQGYKIGDIRGGISVSMLWSPYRQRLEAEQFSLGLGFGTLLIIGLLGLRWSRARLESALIERQVSAEKLRESEERYIRAVDGANDGIWEWIPATGEDYLSPRWKQLLGYEDHELANVQESFFNQIHPEDMAVAQEAVRAHLEERKPYRVALRLLCKGGDYRWFFSRGQAQWDEQGRPLRMSGSITDITDQKLAENMLATTLIQLHERNKELSCLYAITNLASNPQKSITEVIEQAVRLIPPGWLYPEITCARITLEGQLCTTDTFRETPWKLSADIAIAGRKAGAVEVFYLEEKPEMDDGPFLREERALIEDIAKNLGAKAERKRALTDLVESEFRWRFAIEGSGDGLWDWEVPTSTVFFSARWKEMLGYAEDEIGNSLGEWETRIHPDDKAQAMADVQAHLDGTTPYYINEHRVRCKDGSWKWILDRGLVVRRDTAGKALRVIGTHSDVTERKQAADRLLASEKRSQTIIQTAQDGFWMTDLGGRLLEVNAAYCRMSGYSEKELLAMTIAELEATESRSEAQAHMQTIMARGSDRFETRHRRKDGSVFDVEANVQYQAVEGGRMVCFVTDITERKQIEQREHEVASRIERALFGTIGTVSRMMDLRDPYTSGHERRVGEVGAAIAAEMGLDANVQRGLRVAGSLHDVGKITVPAEILSKPGKLSALEYEMIKAHAEQGYEILKDIDFPWPVAEVARQHHERMDGSGYPRGLKGDQIAMEARILAVADAVEAMSSHRPYRPGAGIEKALAEIEQGRGATYDAKVADACLRLFRDKGYAIAD